jgi:hypothetical protein
MSDLVSKPIHAALAKDISVLRFVLSGEPRLLFTFPRHDASYSHEHVQHVAAQKLNDGTSKDDLVLSYVVWKAAASSVFFVGIFPPHFEQKKSCLDSILVLSKWLTGTITFEPAYTTVMGALAAFDEALMLAEKRHFMPSDAPHEFYSEPLRSTPGYVTSCGFMMATVVVTLHALFYRDKRGEGLQAASATTGIALTCV